MIKKYRKKPIVIEAVQWFKNGDHPNDDVFRPFEDTGKIPEVPREGKVVRYFRHPKIPGEATCTKCNNIMHEHGWIDTIQGGFNVCPGDYIITEFDGKYYPCNSKIFESTYEEF